MQGYWFYLAMAALSATTLSLQVHYGLSIIFHLLCLQSILTKKRKVILFTLLTYILFSVISGFSNKVHQKTNFQIDQTEFQITFQNKPLIDGNKLNSIVQTDKKENVVLSYTIKSEEEKKLMEHQFKSGISCNVTGILSKPDENRNENLFNYKQFLFNQNIHWKLKAIQMKKCRDNGKGIKYNLKRVRESALMKIEHTYHPRLIP
ncbi:MAG: DUF4131 domain-containing protein, partial [Heyndrickxia sp.]